MSGPDVSRRRHGVGAPAKRGPGIAAARQAERLRHARRFEAEPR